MLSIAFVITSSESASRCRDVAIFVNQNEIRLLSVFWKEVSSILWCVATPFLLNWSIFWKLHVFHIIDGVIIAPIFVRILGNLFCALWIRTDLCAAYILRIRLFVSLIRIIIFCRNSMIKIAHRYSP